MQGSGASINSDGVPTYARCNVLVLLVAVVRPIRALHPRPKSQNSTSEWSVLAWQGNPLYSRTLTRKKASVGDTADNKRCLIDNLFAAPDMFEYCFAIAVSVSAGVYVGTVCPTPPRGFVAYGFRALGHGF